MVFGKWAVRGAGVVQSKSHEVLSRRHRKPSQARGVLSPHAPHAGRIVMDT